MNDTDLLDSLDQLKQAPFPHFSAKRGDKNEWISDFKGWQVPDLEDRQVYPTFREALRAMVKV